jgi:hypothetical protein
LSSRKLLSNVRHFFFLQARDHSECPNVLDLHSNGQVKLFQTPSTLCTTALHTLGRKRWVVSAPLSTLIGLARRRMWGSRARSILRQGPLSWLPTSQSTVHTAKLGSSWSAIKLRLDLESANTTLGRIWPRVRPGASCLWYVAPSTFTLTAAVLVITLVLSLLVPLHSGDPGTWTGA